MTRFGGHQRGPLSEAGILIMLYGLGALILVAELFIPSHGVLTVVGLGFLIAGVFMTFQNYGERAGLVAIVTCLIALPVFGVAAVKLWPKTWIGRRIAPPNPVDSAADSAVPVQELTRFVGRTGRAISPLRPVGICEFEGKRISCTVEYGIIETGAEVEAVRLVNGTLAVKAVPSTTQEA